MEASGAGAASDSIGDDADGAASGRAGASGWMAVTASPAPDVTGEGVSRLHAADTPTGTRPIATR